MANKIEVLDITRSYSRKLNMSAHGGQQYETIDLYASRTAKDVPVEDSKKVSDALYKMCVDEVEAQVAEIDNEVKEIEDEEVPAPKRKKLKTHVGVEIEQEELEAIAPLISSITLSKSIKDLKAAAAEIQEKADELSESQKEYIQKYFAQQLKTLKENAQ